MDFRGFPLRIQNSHKSTYGRVLNIAGSKFYRGAAYLSSVSPLKVGCGYVALASCCETLASVAACTPDVVLMPFSRVLTEIENFDVISIGCGLSTDFRAKRVFKSVIKRCENLNKPVVIDADGLNILAGGRISPKIDTLVLTPHPKEAAKLLGIGIEEVLANLIECAQKISKKYCCITVLKSEKTVVSSNSGEIYLNTSGNSALSKAGSGDVLCGMVSGLLVQSIKLQEEGHGQISAFDAVKIAVFLHGKTGELAAKTLSEYSVLASDLPNFIPSVISDFTQNRPM